MWRWLWNKIWYFFDWWYPFFGFKPPRFTSFDPKLHPPFPEGTEAWRADIEFVYQYFDPNRRDMAASTMAALCFIRDQMFGRSNMTVSVITVFNGHAGGQRWRAAPDLESALRPYWTNQTLAPVLTKKYD
ncbi:MAG: hypothetical protein JWO15_3598 [Sphingomonadales bacterium]|nr:hypothetical protein [Sphingomonadales bacterium]